MVLIENLLSSLDVEFVLGLLGPGKVDHPVEIRAADRGFGREGHHLLETRDFLERGFLGRFGHGGLFDFFLELVNLFA